jgi:hypothetical protein
MKLPILVRLISTATRMPLLSTVVFGSVAAAPSAAQAPRWKEIGKTASSSAVLIDPRSVRRLNDSVTVTMRARFARPDGEGITSTRTVATFNCANQKVAVKENDSYKGERVVRKNIPTIPGYGVVFGGSVMAVAYDYLCKKTP